MPSRPRRRLRTIFSNKQIEILERAYVKSKYPDACVKREISREAKLPIERVQVWFQNKRTRDKKSKEERNCKSNEESENLSQEAIPVSCWFVNAMTCIGNAINAALSDLSSLCIGIRFNAAFTWMWLACSFSSTFSLVFQKSQSSSACSSDFTPGEERSRLKEEEYSKYDPLDIQTANKSTPGQGYL